MAKQTSKGKCNFCGKTFSKSGMTKHLQACPARLAAIEAAVETPPPGGRQEHRPTPKIFHLQVMGTYATAYWMHLEMPASAMLNTLDQFLRNIWLECCGHLSAFTIAGKNYDSHSQTGWDVGWGTPRGMNVALSNILKPDMKFEYEYDFGSTTDLALKVIAEREGQSIEGQTVFVMARNDPPEIMCDECGKKQAMFICTECAWDGGGWLCEDCARTHKCGTEMFLPVVNSPRAGVCGYTGDADDWYKIFDDFN